MVSVVCKKYRLEVFLERMLMFFVGFRFEQRVLQIVKSDLLPLVGIVWSTWNNFFSANPCESLSYSVDWSYFGN